MHGEDSWLCSLLCWWCDNIVFFLTFALSLWWSLQESFSTRRKYMRIGLTKHCSLWSLQSVIVKTKTKKQNRPQKCVFGLHFCLLERSALYCILWTYNLSYHWGSYSWSSLYWIISWVWGVCVCVCVGGGGGTDVVCTKEEVAFPATKVSVAR